MYKKVSKPVEITVDYDGSGPLSPVTILCSLTKEKGFSNENIDTTTIRHHNQETTKVDGFQERGSFSQRIHYQAFDDVISHLLNNSQNCWQSLSYECKDSRLLGQMKETERDPWGWWVNGQYEKMNYWPGAEKGSMQCACGRNGSCYNRENACNCDSNGKGIWLQDRGDVTSKEDLPVRQLHFGDTGNPFDAKEGRFTLGPLVCQGLHISDDTNTKSLDIDAFSDIFME